MQLLFTCRDIAVKKYSDFLQDCEDELLESLFQNADKASNNQLQRIYFEGRLELMRNYSRVVEDFKQKLNESFQYRFALISPIASPSAANLTLVDKDVLEDEIALSTIISRANSYNQDAIWQLNCRLSSLQEELELTPETNPFAPHQVCQAMRYAFGRCEMDIKARMLIYKEIGRLYFKCFSQVLESLNQHLIKVKILPDLSHHIVRQANVGGLDQEFATTMTSQQKQQHIVKQFSGQNSDWSVEKAASLNAINPVPATPLKDNDSPNQPPVTDQPSQTTSSPAANQRTNVTNIHQTIDQMLEGHNSVSFDEINTVYSKVPHSQATAGGVSFGRIQSGGISGAKDTFTSHQLSSIVSAVQSKANPEEIGEEIDSLSPDNIEYQLIRDLEQKTEDSRQHKLSKEDTQVIDVLGLIFRYILDDEALPNKVAVLLSHLYTPYLKVALLDPQFFNNEKHPARRLINLMAAVGSRWVEHDNDKLVLPKIKHVVTRILTEFDEDLDLFHELLKDFREFAEELLRRAEKSEQRLVESQQGIEKRDIAKQEALDECIMRLDSRNTMPEAKEVLVKPWSEFLTYILIRYTKDSPTWASALKVFDGVVWSVQPDKQFSNAEDFRRRQQAFVKTVEKGLITIGYDQDLSESLLLSLRQAQQIAFNVANGDSQAVQDLISDLNSQEIFQTSSTKFASESGHYIESHAEQQKGLTAKEKRIMNELGQLEFGTWFYFDAKRSRSIELKLAWYSQVTSRYMFVNAMGIKQRVESRRDLAIGIAEGNIEIQAQDRESFMSRALTRVLERLRIMAPA